MCGRFTFAGMTCFPCRFRITHTRTGGYPGRIFSDELNDYTISHLPKASADHVDAHSSGAWARISAMIVFSSTAMPAI